MKKRLVAAATAFFLILTGERSYLWSSSMENMPMDGNKSGAETRGPVQVTPQKRQLIGVKTGLVEKRSLDTIIHAAGSVEYNEKKTSQIQMRVSGWIKELYVDSTGQQIKKGDPLFQLYSPDLFATEQEYLLAKKTLSRMKEGGMSHVREGVESQVESARARLLLWNMTEEQIDRLDEEGEVKPEMVFYSPVKGFVTKKSAVKGQYVTPEMVLYEIADLSTVWVYADIYEPDLGYLRQDQKVSISFTAYPDRTFTGRIIYIAPNLSPETRTVKARIELPNPGFLLKPGMYGDVDIRIKIPKRLVIPVEAVIDSGMRQLAFLDRGNGVFEPREIKLGAHHEGYVEVVSGLKEGDRVVTSATFLVDSESKLMAAASMMGMLGMGGVNMEKATMGKMEMASQPPFPRSKKAGPYVLDLELFPDPPRAGENKISVKIINSQNQIIRDAAVTFSYVMTMPGMTAEEVKGSLVKDAYEGKVKFAMAGGWKIDVLVKRKGQADVKESFTFDVK